ncbi:hypothetical protein HIM_11725 [Hirsutella minnesotensis 3608]|uniref:Peroxin 11C n=1 Tax=Hirsutella minnesotensis 3608 TaxID=1043627 RepID=A0A0F7ZFC1_9HYPO|nr:hypothetical protein HIM_11725 [Hirsutella minnesotensis 3608]
MASSSSEPVVTTLPSGEAAEPSASVQQSPQPPGQVTNKSATVSLAAVPARADAFIAHLQRCLQSRAGADAVLLFLCYSFRLGGSVLETLSRPILRLSARRLVAAAFKLPPATTVVLSATPPHPPLAALALRLGGRFKAMAAMISETRTMGRLWGLLGLYFAAKRLVLKTCSANQESNKSEKTQDEADRLFDTLLAYAQVVSLIVFQGAENLSYLGGKKVLPFPAATQGRLSLISVRSWGLYVGMEVSRLLIERSRRVSSGVAATDVRWMADWRRRFLRNLAWAPLTVHWSTPNGILPDLMVSLLAAYPATCGMLDLWRDTA